MSNDDDRIRQPAAAASAARRAGSGITFDGVSFGYEDGHAILADFNLEIGEGEFFCLLGPSGCGKTTALNIAAGFEHPTGGDVRVGGKPVLGPGVDRPVIFQGDDSLMPWLSAARNVELGLRYSGIGRAQRTALARDAIRLVGLTGHTEKLPPQLSGGMKQRIQIARALVMGAPVLLMDEPFAALDAQVRMLLQEELARIWATTNATVLFITHDISEALVLGDRIGVMSAGPAARLKEIVVVDLPRPRALSQPGFSEKYEHIRGLITDEVKRTLNR